MYYHRQKKSDSSDDPQSNSICTNGVSNYSDPFALQDKLYAEAERYGNVTTDYEAVQSQRLQLISLISNIHQSHGSPMNQNAYDENGKGSASAANGENVLPIAKLEDITDNLPEKPCNNERSIIIVDSDDESAPKETSVKPVDSTSGVFDSRTFTRSTIKDRIKAFRSARMAEGGVDHHFLPSGQVALPSWQPSIQFEKVILHRKPEEEHVQDLMAVQVAQENAEALTLEALAYEKVERYNTPMSTSQNPLSLTYKRKRGRKQKSEQNSPGKKSKQNSAVSSIIANGHAPLATTDSQKERDEESETYYHEEELEPETDGLDDLWNDMSFVMETSKFDTVEEQANPQQEEEDCSHSFLLHDDLGLVCRVCGVIQKKIENIFDYQWKKGPKSRTYHYESRTSKDDEEDYGEVMISGNDFIASDIFIHPRHAKQMKPHQLEGFNFLVKNLVNDKPGGCILAHAPGSGKTFMLISFIQSFLAKYPSARPLVVLPKGILPTWKREFQRWQVEDIPLYDFYSVKAEKRLEQLEVLKAWQENRSILFLGYKQFSTIICHGLDGKAAAACQERLLKIPSLLILDEGHTPRNEETDILASLEKIQTARKVVLSGTLFQNHVREVFNILNLVRPKFLKEESSRAIVKRVLSRVMISGGRRISKGAVDSTFYDLVEDTLQNDTNAKRKINVIKDLRELTKNVLHYYKGDFLDELPGHDDFTVFLKLSSRQRDIVQKLSAYEKFKRTAVGTAVYIHPALSDISEIAPADRVANLHDAKIDDLIDTINPRDGVKTRFFLNILALSESSGEKVLAFSQYILPLKFLERLLVKVRGWRVGKEIFIISGDTSSEDREWSMDQFNNSSEARVLFGSIKACGEGISLVGASRVIILDVHINPSVTRQAIGRAFRPGQQRKVYTYRLVANESPEVKVHETSVKKELIPKMWFEWSEHCCNQDFNLDEISIDECQDQFLESSIVRQDIKSLYKR